MDKKQKGVLAQVCLSLFLFIFIQIVYKGITSSPKELDSILYHIPIAKSYLTGDIFSSPKSPLLHRFFPGASEGILALFILLRIPLNLYNVLGIIILFLSCYFLGIRGGLKKKSALVFAVGFSSLMGVIRWADTQIVDIWIAAYYALLLGLLLKPGKSLWYFLKLGVISGMLIGSKYSGPLYASVALLFIWKRKTGINVIKAITFITPVIILGGFWYMRNNLIMGNPIYPISILGLNGVKNWALELPVWRAIVSFPTSFVTACISEYLGWFVLSLAVVIYVIFDFIKQKKFSLNLVLILISFFNFVFYLFMPNAQTYQVHVSNLRYSYPVFIPLFLVIFRIAQEKKYEGFLFIFALAQILFALQFAYHPKLIFIYLPLIMIQWYQYGRR
ncbi:hypothetical protein COY90_00790 [Candidatus Roizmanbacteria bacterium CG_4_10_14_0_8_um_filter_39_9]|uniref:Glycosyltransferase RgtA/B/C/D-like domain-containing protein n=1 Tax=Candidatus Roizmanbacteria bacterium CG_4_10_14_0_8_um_filter_39_9 TaxID=1974829 RepID=A0A2M7QDW0_9BACT|nr:MAG: hypothetical protein COY90_00790 [Candidatus Roizmanbacteria bacterium CG_4_10_14_0_8_um_filter_39_9]